MADLKITRRMGFAVALLVYALDQFIKAIIIHGVNLPVRTVIEVLPIFRFYWVENHGISMGFLTADGPVERWLLVLLTAGIAVAVVFWLWRERNKLDAAALGLVLGGALGNITDRVRLGYVADFLDLHFGGVHPFLVFNVADAAITVGVLLLVLRALLVRTPAASEKN
ncbi:signal peptidase II [Sphingomonas oryzagri]|uniref:Lipoprotein signal peptidase n=1 Tax=Sphingomonas oryzagri TaxID=3042314 RepID=A0ABT6N4V2_9SPHN|nr:signal peptidase II [Sphingomonas oryzagri]MDH7639891.1 signal peptidase II [Sphingomonas oryzagri]